MSAFCGISVSILHLQVYTFRCIFVILYTFSILYLNNSAFAALPVSVKVSGDYTDNDNSIHL